MGSRLRKRAWRQLVGPPEGKDQHGRDVHGQETGIGSGHASDAAASGDQRDELLPPNRADPVRRPGREACAATRGLQFRLLPPLQPDRDPQRREMGPAETDDVRGRGAGLLLPHHHRAAAVQRAGGIRRKQTGCVGVGGVFLPVLRLFRHRVAGRALAVPDRDQLAEHEDQRRGPGHGVELGLQFHGYVPLSYHLCSG